MTTQATNWQAQLTDGTKMRGGQSNLFSTDVNVSAVPVAEIKVFSVCANTFTDTYYAPTKNWYRNGQPQTYSYPQQYTMGDGSTLTVDYDTTANQLKLTQQ